jgi:hypothetical protein
MSYIFSSKLIPICGRTCPSLYCSCSFLGSFANKIKLNDNDNEDKIKVISLFYPALKQSLVIIFYLYFLNIGNFYIRSKLFVRGDFFMQDYFFRFEKKIA